MDTRGLPDTWRCRDKTLPIGEKTLIMGIVNVTPDSFSDGGEWLESERAVGHAVEMISAGADLIDIGGESTRPGSKPVPAAEELDRIGPVVESLRTKTDVPLSVDTCKPEVARAALEMGADIINDITALRDGDDLAGLAAETGAGLVLMHMRGTPATMQTQTEYEDLIGEIRLFLLDRVEHALSAGMTRDQIVIDPGIGFGKSVSGNLEILARLSEIRSLGFPVLIGPSRKSFIGNVLDRPVENRLMGTASTVALGIAGGASVVRVHDVAEMREVARMSEAILAAGSPVPKGDDR